MNIVCIICSDLLRPSDDVFHTPCGHIFHFTCLIQWLERSPSCPQCREKVTSNKIHRIYFNFFNNDSVTEDVCSLHDKIDKLNFELLLRDKNSKSYFEKSETLQIQNTGLKHEVRKVEKELNEKNSTIYALKEQVKYHKQQNAETESLKQEIERLQNKIKIYKNLQTLLEASSEDVDKMTSNTSDPNTLITYISVMKREMTVSLNKRKELRSKVKSLQQELTKVSMERNFLSEEHVKRKQLEEDLMICESETIHLQNQLKEIEKAKLTGKKSNHFDSKRENKLHSINNDNVIDEDKVGSTVNNRNLEKEESNKEEENQSQIALIKEHKNNSPYLPIKSGGVFGLKQSSVHKRGATKLNSLLLTKKSRIEQTSTRNTQVQTTSITYDGFGGRSKLSQFPNSSDIKIKKMRMT
ncbi:TRAF interacting protein no poles [Ptiloglossa arizonensis]|uniref:TRAF interacting protein no poles n=1 Tax=Ptiloglossa arizonensis TaxID=3350558 RepID=UPI003F9F7180